jgi:hypothetical protein
MAPTAQVDSNPQATGKGSSSVKTGDSVFFLSTFAANLHGVAVVAGRSIPTHAHRDEREPSTKARGKRLQKSATICKRRDSSISDNDGTEKGWAQTTDGVGSKATSNGVGE